jgi:hypothetical protein
MSPVDKGRVVMALFAECVVDRMPAQARTYLAMFPDAEASQKAARRLATPECLEPNSALMVGINIDEMLLRGALYAALYKKAFKRNEPLLTETPVDYWADAKGQKTDFTNQYVAFRQFADCVVHKHGAESRSLVLADVAGEKERAAMAAIIPDLNTCMVAGSKVEFSKSVLIGLIAEALYRSSVPQMKANGEIR